MTIGENALFGNIGFCTFERILLLRTLRKITEQTELNSCDSFFETPEKNVFKKISKILVIFKKR